MNHLLFNAALLLSVISGFTQTNSVRGEFATNLNGLMYSDNDMRSLRFIVDSLNLRFKACDLDKVYYSYPQTTVYHVSFRSADNNLKEIIRQIDNKVSFDQIVSGFSSYISLVDTGELFIRSGTRPNGEGFYYLQGSPYGGYDEIYWDKKYNVADKNLDNEWVYDYSPKDSYTQEYTLSCRYFPGELKRQAIPGKYARLIQYVDCMIDTSSTIFLTERYWGGWYNKDKKPDYYNLKEIADYLDEKMSV